MSQQEFLLQCLRICKWFYFNQNELKFIFQDLQFSFLFLLLTVTPGPSGNSGLPDRLNMLVSSLFGHFCVGAVSRIRPNGLLRICEPFTVP